MSRKTVTQYRTAKRHTIRLIRDRREIEELTGEPIPYDVEPRPRCGECRNPTITLRDHEGREWAQLCKTHEYFWIKKEVQRVITEAVYEPFDWLLEEGENIG